MHSCSHPSSPSPLLRSYSAHFYAAGIPRNFLRNKVHARRDVRCAQTTKYWHCIPGRGAADSVSAEDALVYTSRRVEGAGGERNTRMPEIKKKEGKKSPRYFRAMHFPRSRASRVHIYLPFSISAEMLTGAENAPLVIYISSRERAEKARIIAVASVTFRPPGKNDWTRLSFTTFPPVYEHGGASLALQSFRAMRFVRTKSHRYL